MTSEALPADSLQMDALPFEQLDLDELRPVTLTRQYPYIANRLAELWRQPEQCGAYLKSLIMLDRPTRQGFAFDAAAELNRLLDYCTSVLHPRPHSIWSEIRNVPDSKE